MRNHGLKVLGLALLSALGMMAFTAAGANAQLFLINGGNALLATVTGNQIGSGFLLVPARDLKLECKEFHLETGSEIVNSTDGLAKVTFLECISYSLSGGFPLKNCILKSLGSITAEALVLPFLHNGDKFLLFEQKEGAANFTVVSYKPGIGCVLPLNNPVTGAVVALVDPETAEKLPRRLILFSPEIQLLTGHELNFGGNKSYIHGHAEVELSGAHEGQKLDIH